MPQLTWADLKDQIAQREREAELFIASSQNEEYNPYWDANDVELLLYEISCQLLREIPTDELEAIGSVAINDASYLNGGTLPQSAVKFISASIQKQNGDSVWIPAIRVDPARYYQMKDVSVSDAALYTFIDGKVFFSGNTISLSVLVEPELWEFQADFPILPVAGYDEVRIDWVHKALMAEDFIPAGRL